VKQITSSSFSLSVQEQIAVPDINVDAVGERKQAMARQAMDWRSTDGERRWLLRLIDTMEKISRRDAPVALHDNAVLSGLRLQLARPIPPYSHWQAQSHFSLRNEGHKAFKAQG